MIGVLFELQKKLNLYARNQREHVWRSEGHVHVIQGSRVLVTVWAISEAMLPGR